MLDFPILGLIIGVAAINAINPVSLGLFTMVCSTLLGRNSRPKKLVVFGGVYLLNIAACYVLVGTVLSVLLGIIPTVAIGYLYLGLALISLMAGLSEIKDYFWYGKGFMLQIPAKLSSKIHAHANKKGSMRETVTLGLFSAWAKFISVGIPYLAVLVLLPHNSLPSSVGYSALYSLVFIAPLLLILSAVTNGSKISVVSKWKEESKGSMRLFNGLLLISLGWLLILAASGTVNFG